MSDDRELNAQLIDAVLAEARRYVGVTEQPPGSNRGTEVDYWVKETQLNPAGGYPWCAAFVGAVGRQAIGLLWRVPHTASVQQIAKWADAQGVLFAAPQRGDLMLLWEPHLQPARFGHVGFVDKVDGAQLTTIEGNTNSGGSREGYGVFERTRDYDSSMRFVRWVLRIPKGVL